MFNYEEMKNKIILADCMEVMKKFKDKEFDLAIVDPPYGIGEDGGKQIEWKSRPNSIGKKPKYQKKGWDNNIPDENYFNELFRISKNQIIWGGNYFTNLLKPNGCWIVWDKMIEIKMFTGCELAWTSFNKNIIKRFQCHPFNNLKGGKIKQHPTQKPVKLYEWLLLNYAKEGDTILDTHFGSLSIGIACEKLGFELTAIELDKDYYRMAKQRLLDFKKQLTIEF